MRRFMANVLMGNCAASRNILQPIVNFGLRFYVAYVFFKSGLTKVDDNYMITESTLGLFDLKYNVPLLQSNVAAYLATYAELILPILLVIGFLSRPAALGLFILNAVAMIYVATTESAAVGLWQHIAWGAMLAMPIVYGPSKMSIDSWIANKFRGRDSSLILKLIGIIILSGIGYVLINKYL